MSASTIHRTFAQQHAFNCRVWQRLSKDPRWNDVLEKLETDRDGNVIIARWPEPPIAFARTESTSS